MHREPGRNDRRRVPARLAVARVQASGYYSRSNTCYGSGRYCVVTTRDIEPEAAFERLSKLPQVAGLALMNRMLLPGKLTSAKDLRQAGYRRAAILCEPAFRAVPELVKAMEQLDEEKYAKVMAYLKSPADRRVRIGKDSQGFESLPGDRLSSWLEPR